MPKVSLCQNRVPSKPGHKPSQGRYSMLEPDEGKLSRPVLRRGDGSNSVSLAGELSLRLFYHCFDDHTPFKRHLATANQGVTGSHYLRPIGSPLNPMECANFYTTLLATL